MSAASKVLAVMPGGAELGIGFWAGEMTKDKSGPVAALFTTESLKNAARISAPRSTTTFRLIRTNSQAMDDMNISGELGLKMRTGAATVDIQGSGKYVNNKVNRQTTIEILASVKIVSHSLRLDATKLELMPEKAKPTYKLQAVGGSHFVSELVYGGGMQISMMWKFTTSEEKENIEAAIHGNVTATSVEVDVKGQFSKIATKLNERADLNLDVDCWGDVTPDEVVVLPPADEKADTKAPHTMVEAMKADPMIVLKWLSNAEDVLRTKEQNYLRNGLQKSAYLPLQLVITPLATLTVWAKRAGELKNQQMILDAEMASLGDMYDTLRTCKAQMEEVQHQMLDRQRSDFMPASDRIPADDKQVEAMLDLQEKLFDQVVTALKVVRDFALGKATPAGFTVGSFVAVNAKLARDANTLIAKFRWVMNGRPHRGNNILMFTGFAKDIPAGYNLCDGANGTPDLRGRFLVGVSPTLASGPGAARHSHKVDTGSTKTVSITFGPGGKHVHSGFMKSADSKTQSLDSVAPPGFRALGVTDTSEEPDHSHTPVQIDLQSAVTEDAEALPPYYALCFIMPAK